ncbi:hypothetical protein EON66_03740 [archaeon]|nr:MAG: hypothetical protein EON66_03740 [archaeon]
MRCYGGVCVQMEGSGFLAQLDQDRFDSLRRLYKLCVELPEQVAWEMPAELALSEMTRMRHSAAVHMLKDVMKAHIIRHGFDVMKATTTPKAGGELVDALLTLRAKYVRIVTQAFDGDAQFMTGVKEVRTRPRHALLTFTVRT